MCSGWRGDPPQPCADRRRLPARPALHGACDAAAGGSRQAVRRPDAGRHRHAGPHPAGRTREHGWDTALSGSAARVPHRTGEVRGADGRAAAAPAGNQAGRSQRARSPVLRLHPDAERLWIAFYNAVEGQLLPGGELASIKAFGAKLAEHAGRLAAVLTVYADPDAMDVPAEMMANGIDLARYYAAEMLRLQGACTVSIDLRLAARLLAWWQARPDPQCHLAGIYQRGLNALGDAATARRIVGILEEHGWLERLQAGTEVDGRIAVMPGCWCRDGAGLRSLGGAESAQQGHPPPNPPRAPNPACPHASRLGGLGALGGAGSAARHRGPGRVPAANDFRRTAVGIVRIVVAARCSPLQHRE